MCCACDSLLMLCTAQQKNKIATALNMNMGLEHTVVLTIMKGGVGKNTAAEHNAQLWHALPLIGANVAGM